MLTSCATQYYAFDGDYNGKKPDVELSEDEQELQERLVEQARVVESFPDAALEAGFRQVGSRTEFTRYPMDRPRNISSFQIGANDGGAGAVDWIAVR